MMRKRFWRWLPGWGETLRDLSARSMLRTRLLLNFVPFVVMLLAVGLYAIALFSRLAVSVDTKVTESYRSVMSAQAMSLALAGMDREIPWASGGERSPDAKAFAGYEQRFQENLAAQAKSAMLPGEEDLRRQVIANFHAFREAVSALASFPQPESQMQIYEQEVEPALRTLNSLLEKTRDLNHEAILGTSRSIQKITLDVTRLMVLGMAVALIISAYACYQLSRSILRPIQALTRATRELGKGNLEQMVPVLASDELGELAIAFNQMAAQLQEYRHSTTEKIVRLHRTMETTLASFPDPIFVMNSDGRIKLRNPAAEQLASKMRLGKTLPVRLETIARQTLATGENFIPSDFEEALCVRLNGSEKFFLPRVVAMRNKEGALFGVAVVLNDVTRFRLLDAVKTNLVATVSHELRTPLTSVRMVLHILLEKTVGTLTPKQEELLLAARQDAERLIRILSDLLDLARLEEGNAGLNKEPVTPAELLQGVVAELKDQASAKDLAIHCELPPDLPAVAVDRQRVNHVFSNLIANAVKHSPLGGEIFLRAAPTEDEGVLFSITDQGPGIPEEYQDQIFDRFFRVPGQNKPGAGLGLSIAREITVAHGGRIGVRSKPGHGSTFYVMLKAAERLAPAPVQNGEVSRE